MRCELMRLSEEEFDKQCKDPDIYGIPFCISPSGRVYPKPPPENLEPGLMTVVTEGDEPHVIVHPVALPPIERGA